MDYFIKEFFFFKKIYFFLENWKIKVSFTRSFLKHILGKHLYIEDLDDISDDLGKTYLQTLEIKNIE